MTSVLLPLLDRMLAFLRIAVSPTVSTGELLFAPFIAVALLFHAGNAVAMWRLRRRLRRDAGSSDLAASATEHLRRAQRGMLRLGCWALICWALLVNWPYASVAFSFLALCYAVVEAVDGALNWLYQYRRALYWRNRDSLDDYAEKVAATAAADAAAARDAAQEARAAAQAAAGATKALLAAVAENTKLTIHAGERADAAYHEANNVNEKIAAIGEEQVVQADRTEAMAADTNERLRQVVPKIVTPQEHADADPPGSTLTVGEQIEQTQRLAEQALRPPVSAGPDPEAETPGTVADKPIPDPTLTREGMPPPP